MLSLVVILIVDLPMKKYTLEIIYDEKSGDLISLKEIISNKEDKIAITASAEAMDSIVTADLVEELLVPCPGEIVGES
tara:strand:+ start:253 stop:486 length:234 start_codon:yes stop_codon:yes gene_type:complete